MLSTTHVACIYIKIEYYVLLNSGSSQVLGAHFKVLMGDFYMLRQWGNSNFVFCCKMRAYYLML